MTLATEDVLPEDQKGSKVVSLAITEEQVTKPG